MENVCLSVDDDSFMYAVGSKAHTDLLDARTLQVRTIRYSYDYKCEIYKMHKYFINFIHIIKPDFYFRKLEISRLVIMAVVYVRCHLRATY